MLVIRDKQELNITKKIGTEYSEAASKLVGKNLEDINRARKVH